MARERCERLHRLRDSGAGVPPMVTPVGGKGRLGIIVTPTDCGDEQRGLGAPRGCCMAWELGGGWRRWICPIAGWGVVSVHPAVARLAVAGGCV